MGHSTGGHRAAKGTATQRRLPAMLLAVLFLCTAVATTRAQAPTTSTEGAPAASQTTPQTNPNNPVNVPEASQNATPSGQPAQPGQPGSDTAGSITNPLPALSKSIWLDQGKTVTAIQFEGVSFSDKDTTVAELSQKAGAPLDANKVRDDLRRLFATGRYRDIGVYEEPNGDGITLIFAGTPRFYVGRVEVDGISRERLASLEQFATKLEPGTPYTESQVPAAVQGIRESLASNGYFEPAVSVKTTTDDKGHQVDATFDVNTGLQARVGQVAVQGKDTGISVPDFRKWGGLNCSRLITLFDHHCSPKVTRDTTANALNGVRKHYQKNERLEGTISLQKQTYVPERKQLDYDFEANQGPLVHVIVKGAKLSKSRVKLIVPIYEEGTVDIDLLNEGAFNIRDYLQQKGYFDVTDSVQRLGQGTGEETVEFDVNEGRLHKVTAVNIEGNKYFDTDTLMERMRVKKADLYQRSGAYSTNLVNSDKNAMLALYKASGFSHATVTTSVKDTDVGEKGQQLKTQQIAVTFKIVEGIQQKFGAVKVEGVDPSREATIRGLMSTQTGQPFSLLTLSGDRDAVLGWYVSHGFDHARVEFNETAETGDPTRTDVTMTITEGRQVFIDQVLLSGIKHTKPSLVEHQMLVHPGDPLDQAALLQTQRNLYNLALFNEVNAAVQNPTGHATEKNVLVQITEAKRWDVTYGFGFEAQTGTPQFGPYQTGRGTTAAQNGHAGVSPRVSVDVSRINLFGSQKSLTLHATYGLLEKVATLSLNNPQFLGHRDFTATLSGGYSNVQNITTFQASTLQGDFRVTQKYKKADTFIYDFQYRRVSVNPNSLEITPNLVSQLSQPVTVGGPGITYFHDTRDPSPLDAGRGQYYSVQEFISNSIFGAATDFNRLDFSHSSYYTFGKKKYVFARNTRVAFENFFGGSSGVSDLAQIGQVANCSPTILQDPNDPSSSLLNRNATCNPIPLPERLYAGGATSHRGFGINAAGPRDLTTGYPVGGSGAVVNQFELRLPPPTLPLVGSSVSFVIFHDMGNVFRYPRDMFSSLKNFHQPNQASCSDLTGPLKQANGDVTKAVGVCSFNYYSHAIGLGARYKTPVGPIRLDFSYNLNPPVYPVFDDYTSKGPHVGQANHFNFFFSIGQAF